MSKDWSAELQENEDKFGRCLCVTVVSNINLSLTGMVTSSDLQSPHLSGAVEVTFVCLLPA
jgi:hypothetical protein